MITEFGRFLEYRDDPTYPFRASDRFSRAMECLDRIGWTSHPLDELRTAGLGTNEQQREIVAAITAEKTFFAWEYWAPEGFFDSSWVYHPMRATIDVLRTALYLLRAHAPDELVHLWLDYVSPGIAALDPAEHPRALDLIVDLLGDRAEAYTQKPQKNPYAHPTELLIQIFHRCNLPLVTAAEDTEVPTVHIHFHTAFSWSDQAEIILVTNPHKSREIALSREVILGRWDEWLTASLFVMSSAPSPWSREYPLLDALRPWPEESRETTMRYVLNAYRSAESTEDIKGWAEFLIRGIQITADEIVAHTDILAPLLFRKDSTSLLGFGTVLAERAEEDTLPEVLTAVLNLAGRATRVKVLKAADRRPTIPSPEVLEQCRILLGDAVAADDHPSFTKAVNALAAKWDVNLENLSETTEADATLWQAPSPPWSIPEFVSSEKSLSALAADELNRGNHLFSRGPNGWCQISSGFGWCSDLESEHFTDSLVRGAFQNPEATKAELIGVPRSGEALEGVRSWAEGKLTGKVLRDITNNDRQREILHLLGRVPVLLSTPDRADLSVSATTVLARLREYEVAAAPVGARDLFIMLARLRDREPVLAALEALDLELSSWEPLEDISVAATISVALGHKPADEKKWQYLLGGLTLEDHLLERFFHWYHPSSTSPPYWHLNYTDRPGVGLGRMMRQLARTTTMTPAQSMAFIGQLSNLQTREVEEGWLAVTEAWERGLLVPGKPDLTVLTQEDGSPQRVAKLSETLEGMAETGMLALVWPILTDLVETSAARSKATTGTPALLGVIKRLLPHVTAAVRAGTAPQSALDLAGVRILAVRKGHSRTVVLAREIAESLITLPPPSERR